MPDCGNISILEGCLVMFFWACYLYGLFVFARKVGTVAFKCYQKVKSRKLRKPIATTKCVDSLWKAHWNTFVTLDGSLRKSYRTLADVANVILNDPFLYIDDEAIWEVVLEINQFWTKCDKYFEGTKSKAFSVLDSETSLKECNDHFLKGAKLVDHFSQLLDQFNYMINTKITAQESGTTPIYRHSPCSSPEDLCAHKEKKEEKRDSEPIIQTNAKDDHFKSGVVTPKAEVTKVVEQMDDLEENRVALIPDKDFLENGENSYYIHLELDVTQDISDDENEESEDEESNPDEKSIENSDDGLVTVTLLVDIQKLEEHFRKNHSGTFNAQKYLEEEVRKLTEEHSNHTQKNTTKVDSQNTAYNIPTYPYMSELIPPKPVSDLSSEDAALQQFMYRELHPFMSVPPSQWGKVFGEDLQEPTGPSGTPASSEHSRPPLYPNQTPSDQQLSQLLSDHRIIQDNLISETRDDSQTLETSIYQQKVNVEEFVTTYNQLKDKESGVTTQVEKECHVTNQVVEEECHVTPHVEDGYHVTLQQEHEENDVTSQMVHDERHVTPEVEDGYHVTAQVTDEYHVTPPPEEVLDTSDHSSSSEWSVVVDGVDTIDEKL